MNNQHIKMVMLIAQMVCILLVKLQSCYTNTTNPTTIDYFINNSYLLLDTHTREKVIPFNKFPPKQQDEKVYINHLNSAS